MGHLTGKEWLQGILPCKTHNLIDQAARLVKRSAAFAHFFMPLVRPPAVVC